MKVYVRITSNQDIERDITANEYAVLKGNFEEGSIMQLAQDGLIGKLYDMCASAAPKEIDYDLQICEDNDVPAD